MFERRQGFTLTQNLSSVFRPTLLTQRTVNQPHNVAMSDQDVMFSKEGGNKPGLYSAKG